MVLHLRQKQQTCGSKYVQVEKINSGEKQKQTRLFEFRSKHSRAEHFHALLSTPFAVKRYDASSKLEKVRRSSLVSERAPNSSSLKTWARDQNHPVSGQNRRFTAELYARSGLGGLLYLTLLNKNSKKP